MASAPISSIYCARCVMLHPDGYTVPPDWSFLYSPRQVLLSSISFSSMNMSGATLPGTIPSSISQFLVSGCSLTGTIPENFLMPTVGPGYGLDLSNNDLYGSIPPDLFAGFPGLSSFGLNLRGNRFTHLSAPLQLPTFQFLGGFSLDLSDNQIGTPIDDVLPPNPFFNTFPDHAVSIALSNNKFYGSVPTSWFSFCLNATSCTISLGNNSLTGTLPQRMFPSNSLVSNFKLNALKVELNDNQLSGDIPAELFDLKAINPSFSTGTWTISLQNNRLNGTIAPSLFTHLNWTKVMEADFNFASNQLTGDLPASGIGNATAPMLYEFTLDVSNNSKLTGSIPPSFLESFVPSTLVTAYGSLILRVSDTGLSGRLHIPSFGLRTQIYLRLFASNANFSSISFDPSAWQYLSYLDINYNTKLVGTLPDSLFNASSLMIVLLADNTLLSGTMPDLGALEAPALSRIRLGYTAIDFCSEPRSLWNSSFLYECSFISTSASTCKGSYPEKCVTEAPVAPMAEPVPFLSTCPLATRPSPEFVCIGNTWTFIGTVTTPVLTLPAGSTSTVVGNVTSPAILITGLQSTLIVEGCVTNLSTVTVVLTPEELEKIGSGSTTVPLIYYNSSDTSCTSNLDGVKIVPLVKGSTCRKVVARPQQSSGSLSALFTVDNGKCRVWWIVLVSVICAVVIIAVIITIVVVTHFKAAKNLEYKKQLQS